MENKLENIENKPVENTQQIEPTQPETPITIPNGITQNSQGSRNCPCKDLEVLKWRRKKRWAFVFLFGLSCFVAGCLYILIVYKNNWDKGLFYVLNKEGFNGYFFAWSITLVTSSLVSYIHSLIFGHKEIQRNDDTFKSKCKFIWNNYISVMLYKNAENKKKAFLCSIKSLLIYVFAGILLYFAFSNYLEYSKKLNSELESFVDSIKIEKLVGDDFLSKKGEAYTSTQVDSAIRSIVPMIDTKEFVDRIDNNSLKSALVRYNYEIVNPPRHVNNRMIRLVLFSLLYSIVVFWWTYPKPEDDK